MGRTFAYCRVSASDHTPENEAHEIAAAGFAIEPHRIIADTVSGGVQASARSAFAKLLEKLESGDVLVVTKLVVQSRHLLERIYCESFGLRNPAFADELVWGVAL
jgi:putative DNA-invertase from lambdoid prophage Rac